MNTKFLLLALVVVALSSCSTAYKSGQTPDDVYFSPAKEQKEEYVNVEERQDRNRSERYNPDNNNLYNNSPYNNNSVYNNNPYNSYDDFNGLRNDRMLRMSIGSRMRLSTFDDYYWNDGYSSWKYNNYGSAFNNPWNSYHYWNNYYNPYARSNMYNPYYSSGYYGNFGGGNIVIVNPKTSSAPVPVTRPRVFNPGLYSNNSYSNNNVYLDRNVPTSRPNTNSSNTRYNNTNRTNSSGLGNTMRKIFAPDNGGYYNNTNSGNTQSRGNRSEVYNAPAARSNTYEAPAARSNTYEAPSRSYTPSTPAPSSGSSSGGGGVTRPTRGGN